MSTTHQPSDLAADFPSSELREDPYPFYERLRLEAPVHRLADGSWLVSRYDDIMRVVGDPKTYSSQIGPLSTQSMGGPRVGGDDSGPWSLPNTDGAQHRKQRSFASAIVRRHRLDWFEPNIERLVDELIDDFGDAGVVEFRSAFAEPLPRRVMMHTFGFPIEDEPDIVRWTTGPGIGSKYKRVGADQPSPEAEADELRVRMEMIDYVRAQVHKRSAQPTDDFLSEMVHAQVERDGELDANYLVAEATGLFAGGFLTTAHMLANTLLLLLKHPAQVERARADRSLLPALLEESLRLESPVQFLQRITTTDTELGGVRIPAGSSVVLLWGSANRDETRFDAPAEFHAGRSSSGQRHLAFGSGVHKCIGAPLARMEGRIALNRLLDRLPNLRLAEGRNDDVSHVLPFVNMRAPSAVYIAFDPPTLVAGRPGGDEGDGDAADICSG